MFINRPEPIDPDALREVLSGIVAYIQAIVIRFERLDIINDMHFYENSIWVIDQLTILTCQIFCLWLIILMGMIHIRKLKKQLDSKP